MSNQHAGETPVSPSQSGHDPAARRALILLTLVYVLGYADRSIINLLLEPIKQEYQVSDTVMGLVTGLGFTAFQTILGLPVARWADNSRRVAILAGGLLLWSVMTGLSGLATSAALLAVARMGVGVGEACLTGPSHSILSRMYSKADRPRAFSIMAAGAEVGVILALLVGGWVNHVWGWRAAFIVAGLPGIVLAAVIWFWLEEPGQGATPSQRDTRAVPLRQALSALVSRRSYVIAVVASMAMGLNIFGLQVWAPAYLNRIYHLDIAAIGITIACLRAVLSVTGAVSGGTLTSWCAHRFGQRWLMLTPAWICGLSGLTLIGFLFAPGLVPAIIMLGLTNMLIGAQLGPVFSLVQSVAPLHSRALAAALFVSLTQLFGMGIGALLIGMVSDALHGDHGPQALRYAMLIPSVGAIVGGLLYAYGSLHVERDIASAEADNGVNPPIKELA